MFPIITNSGKPRRLEKMLVSGRVSDLAHALVRSGALKFGSFKLRSGTMSPYYIDLSWLLSSPESFKQVVDIVVNEARHIMSSFKTDKLASIELKGALLLPSIAYELNVPCLVVRKESKRYGLTGMIAGGVVNHSDRILFFDDVVTDARSKVDGIKPIESLGGKISAVLVVVDREQSGKTKLEEMGYKLYSVATISEIVESLLSSREIPEEQAKNIFRYVKEYSSL